MFALVCNKKFLPSMPYQLLTQGMGMAPGFRAPLRWMAPLGKQLVYGTPQIVPRLKDGNPGELNRILLGRTNHTGSDVRIASEPLVES